MQNYPRLSDRVVGGWWHCSFRCIKDYVFFTAVSPVPTCCGHIYPQCIYMFFNESVILDYVRVNAIV